MLLPMYSNMDVEDVGSFHAEPTDDEDRDPYENSRGIPVKGVIPVGSTITASDLSTPGSGSKIVAWDWQVVYYKENDQGKMGDIYDENPDYILKGWYFTAIKFKIEEVRKLG